RLAQADKSTLAHLSNAQLISLLAGRYLLRVRSITSLKAIRGTKLQAIIHHYEKTLVP
ncbi:MAG: hypothetical protein Q9192_005616, partial [Flavoplaca navasiana]